MKKCLYNVVKVLAAINKLSVHDANKRRLIDSGILDIYSRLLDSQHSTLSELLLTTQGLWTLAMDCPHDVANQQGCIQRTYVRTPYCHVHLL